MPQKVNILGTAIDNVDRAEALECVAALVRARRPALVVTPNVDHLVNLQRDAEFREIYRQASLVLADGVPLLWAARFLGTPIREKLSGSDIFHDLCRLAAERGFRVFFLGGRAGAASRAAEILRRRHPRLQIVGVHSPPQGFERNEAECARIDAMLTAARPDLLLVGLGSPKQERWFAGNSSRLGIPVTMGIGITFEYTAGIVRRAPVWMQSVGLEWLFRLLMEPRRLWRRYLVNDPRFFWLVLKQRLGRGATAESPDREGRG
jgi:N-acetylglucosaminyldiphosphoundecaprenol N-acetyl-beta-D-mannosaminyltransferase